MANNNAPKKVKKKLDSASKRALQAAKNRQRNVHRKSVIKTAIKKVLEALAGQEFGQAQDALRFAESQIARAKGKGVLHPNTAARKISRLASKVAAARRAEA